MTTILNGVSQCMIEQTVYISAPRTGRGNDVDIRIILTEVKSTLLELRAKVQRLEAVGYDPGTDAGSMWIYMTKHDEDVCNVCRPLHGRIYSGPTIGQQFPFATNIDEELIEPNTHAPRDLHCRCKLILQNLDKRVEDKIDRELWL